MKKTLISLITLAGVASAALTEDSTLTGITGSANNSYSWTTDASSAAITLILSDTALSKLSTGATGWNEGLGGFALTGGSVNYVTAEYKTDDNPNGIRVTNTNIGTAWGNNDLKELVISNSDLGSASALDTAKYAALTFAIDSDGVTHTLLSVVNDAGVITDVVSASTTTGVTFTGIDGVRINKNGAVSEAYIYSGSWTTTDLATVTSNVLSAKVPAIPEPATATLSLLALCGLAARRRRK